jgi:chromosome condensin MukBEF complex kleisin-like MukF subunit
MRQLDLKQLAAKVSVEHGIRVDLDDPIMAVVTLNRLVLEQSANEIVEGVRSATREFEQAAENVQVRAGTLVAQRVRDCIGVLRHEIAKDIGNASTRSKTSIGDVGRADEHAVVQRWVAIGLLSGAVLFGCGVWLGTMLR